MKWCVSSFDHLTYLFYLDDSYNSLLKPDLAGYIWLFVGIQIRMAVGKQVFLKLQLCCFVPFLIPDIFKYMSIVSMVLSKLLQAVSEM